MIKEGTDTGEGVESLYGAPVDSLWWKHLILENGKLDDTKTTSEYERGFIDCWNELWQYSLYV